MTLNDAITTYIEQQARANEAGKLAAAAKDFILATCGDVDEFTTDLYRVYVKRTQSTRLDTKALYKDFPDIKETYGKTTVSRSLDPHPLTVSEVLTA